jgi:hemerythrin-like metal-binding protein
MDTIVWRDDFSVGVKRIDIQHQTFINIFNRFVQAYQNEEAQEILNDTLKEMLDYLKTHFSEEEAWMEKLGYPGLEDHKKEHRMFVRKTGEFVDRYFEGTDDITDELTDFLSEWFIGHVLGTDMKYVPHFKTHLSEEDKLSH